MQQNDVILCKCKEATTVTEAGQHVIKVAFFVEGIDMAKEFARAFYSSKKWQDCRNGYAAYRSHLCENCLKRGIYKPGEIVHHKIEISPKTIDRPEIALNWDNLELLCRECHAAEHGQTFAQINERKRARRDANRRFKVGENGKICAVDPPTGRN